MGRPINDGLVEETKEANVDEVEFTFHHTPPLYGSICFVTTGIVLALFISIVGEYLSYPSVKDATFMAYDGDFFPAIPAHATVEVLASGFAHLIGLAWVPDAFTPTHDEDRTSSPVWQYARLFMRSHGHRSGSVLFSDGGSNTIYKWRDGAVSVYARPAGYTGPFTRKTLEHTLTGPLVGPAGLAITPERQTVVCQHGDRRVALMTDVHSFQTIFDSDSAGDPFNSPHRVVARSSGDLYITDPPLGLAHGEESVLYHGYAGVYWYSHVTGQAKLLTKALGQPTGVALRSDERVLYIADNAYNGTSPPAILSLPLRSDGSMKPSASVSVFFESPSMNDKFAGLTVDSENRVYAAHGNGVTVISPEGRALGRIELAHSEAAQDLRWDATHTTLYVVTPTRLLRVTPDTHRLLT